MIEWKTGINYFVKAQFPLLHKFFAAIHTWLWYNEGNLEQLLGSCCTSGAIRGAFFLWKRFSPL